MKVYFHKENFNLFWNVDYEFGCKFSDFILLQFHKSAESYSLLNFSSMNYLHILLGLLVWSYWTSFRNRKESS